MKLGRNRPKVRFPQLSLKNYLMKGLPSLPVSVDYFSGAAKALAQMYLNDVDGDCVIACSAHIVGLMTSDSGTPFLFSETEIESLNTAICGDSSCSQGADIPTALAYWQNNGLFGNGIVGSLSLDSSNPEEYRAALWLFENLVFGLELPDAWINPYPSASGFVWDVAGSPDPNNGHCVAGIGYSSKGIEISTWGMRGLMTDAAIAAYCSTANSGEIHSVISQEAIISAYQKAPNGFDWSQLIADFQSIGGTVSLK